MTGASPFKRVVQTSLMFEGLRVNAWVGGRGPNLLLLHGSGPGASSVGNWRPVLDRLAERYRVLALDLIGFGESDRKPTAPAFDFDLWLRQAAFGMAQFDAGPVGVIGHSVSAAIALRLAASTPRITRVLTTGAMGAPFAVNPHLAYVWRCPRTRDAMATAARMLIHDPGLITDAYLDARMAIIGDPAYQDYFDAMFVGDFAPYIDAAVVPEPDLSALRCDVMLMHGRDDRAFPAAQLSAVLAPRIANADLMLLSHCSHSVAMERTETFIATATALFG
jgi:2-hydroxymuconate-semialdehyde hydrolase